VLWVADANFGMYDRDIELAAWICDVKKKYGFPREVVVNYTKNATNRLAKIVEVFAENGICSQGIISIQSRDEATLEVINRKNIKTDKYNDLSDIFKAEGLPLSTDLMMGLPGITVEAFKRDLQFYFDKDVEVKAYRTQLLPNSPMADPDYIEKYQIVVDKDDFLISSFSYTEAELDEMQALFQLFSLADSYAVLRYVLRYLQWEHGIEALDFIHRLQKEMAKERYPAINHATRIFLGEMTMPGGWQPFYSEIARFTEEAFNIPRTNDFDVVLRFNESVMPDDGITYPLKFEIDHDVMSYFNDHILNDRDEIRRLRSYPPAQLVIHDKYFFASIDYASQQYDSHQTFWELQSAVSRNTSVPNFV